MPQISTKHWIIAVLIALAAHLALAAAWPESDAVIEGGAKGVGEGGVDIGIGLAGTGGGFADLPDEAAKSRAQEKPFEQPKPVEKVKPELSKKRRVEKPVVPVSNAVAPVVAVESKAAVDKNVAAVTSAEKSSSERTASPVSVAKDATHFSEGATGDGTGPAGDGGAGNRAGRGGVVSAQQNYYGKIALWLAKHKRYPREAKKARITGTVTVRFTIDSEGTLLGYELVNSSQQPLLDQAAVAMLKLASPFPPIPSSLGMSQLTLSLPVEYSLKR